VRALVLILVCVGLVAALAACGGDDDEAGGDTTAAVQPIDETETDALSSEECLELLGLGVALAQAFTGSAGGDAQETSELLDELVAKAPEEIRADIETLAAGYAEYVEVLRDLDLQEGETPSAEQLQEIQTALASLDQPELRTASERVSAWAEENC